VQQDAATRKAQTRAQFNSIVADYDAAGPGCFAHFGRRLVAVAGVEPGQRVLDVATGRGAVLFPAAERVGAAGEAVGVDLAEGMAEATAEEAAARGLRVQVRVMDAERLDFPEAAFDRVLCGFGVMFFPDLDRALGEFRRVLKPGGRIGISTWRVSQTEDLATVLEQLGVQRGTPPGWIAEPDALARPLARAGFADVQIMADSETFRYADLEEYWQTARGTGHRRQLDSLDAAQTARVRAALAERLRPQQRSDGLYVTATALLAVASR
jgi:ubiquinone/menaquinone biosynthesis C-methylase UbiE